MSARRALTEPMEVGFAVEVACARRATPSPALVDDTLSSVRSSSRRAIAAPLSFEPDEPLDSTRTLPRVTVGGPQPRRSTSRLQRSLLSIAAAATAGAALIVPSLSSQVTAAEVITTPAAAVNTSVSRQAVAGHAHAAQAGGLSGAPLFQASNHVIRTLRTALGPEYPIIGVGGVMSGDDALAKLQAGANLVQIYTGLIYCGPALVSDAVRATRSA